MRKTNFRLLQIIILACSLYLAVSALRSNNLTLLILEILMALLSIWQLFSLTPDQIEQGAISPLREIGIYPMEGQGTDEDVKKLVGLGHKILAIRLYREIHNVPLKQAVDAVKQLA